mmetsp:Transcript_43717/g.93007  ORF Transcript_43717/g.93007 Transcript_43717/m.93007 type:complete len:368 (-) Transcript_43717:1353-2456(-)
MDPAAAAASIGTNGIVGLISSGPFAAGMSMGTNGIVGLISKDFLASKGSNGSVGLISSEPFAAAPPLPVPAWGCTGFRLGLTGPHMAVGVISSGQSCVGAVSAVQSASSAAAATAGAVEANSAVAGAGTASTLGVTADSAGTTGATCTSGATGATGAAGATGAVGAEGAAGATGGSAWRGAVASTAVAATAVAAPLRPAALGCSVSGRGASGVAPPGAGALLAAFDPRRRASGAVEGELCDFGVEVPGIEGRASPCVLSEVPARASSPPPLGAAAVCPSEASPGASGALPAKLLLDSERSLRANLLAWWKETCLLNWSRNMLRRASRSSVSGRSTSNPVSSSSAFASQSKENDGAVRMSCILLRSTS